MDVEKIHAIAQLARLEFTQEQAASFAAEFERIVEYIGSISAVEGGNTGDGNEVGAISTPLRADIVGECNTTEEALRNAPSKNEAFFKVPKVLG